MFINKMTKLKYLIFMYNVDISLIGFLISDGEIVIRMDGG